jgi:hypothetical protein
MTAIRLMAVLELLVWPAILAAVVIDKAWLALALVIPAGLFRMSIAVQALRRPTLNR